MSQNSTFTKLSKKNILVLSDSEFLFDIIQVTLQWPRWQVECAELNSPERTSALPGNATDIDLIIVASSTITNEPVVVLARAGLTDHIGCIPILIVSDRFFESSLKEQIYHLDFPFEPAQLCHQVRALLA